MIRAFIIGASWVLAAAGAVAHADEPPAPDPAPAAAPAAAAPAAPKAWSSMSTEQQQLLHGYQDKWDSLPPERQQALVNGSQRWLSMTPRTAVECAATLQSVARHAAGAAPSVTAAMAAVQELAAGATAALAGIVQPLSANGARAASGIAQTVASDESRTAPPSDPAAAAAAAPHAAIAVRAAFKDGSCARRGPRHPWGRTARRGNFPG